MLGKICSLVLERWRLVLVQFFLVAGLLSLGLHMRNQFIASATINIGGVLNDNLETGIFQFRPFEDAHRIEAFFSHYLFVTTKDVGFKNCSAKVMYHHEVPKLKVECKGRSDAEVRGRILSVIEPFLVYQSRYFEIAQRLEEHRKTHGELYLRNLEKRILILQEQPISSVSRANILAYQFEIARLADQRAIDRSFGEKVKSTHLSSEGIKVLQRSASWSIWLAVCLLAVGFGIVSAVFIPRLDGYRNAS